MSDKPSDSCKRPYELGERFRQMDRTKTLVLAEARKQLESGGVRDLSMESLANAAGVTRQTIYNLFGTRRGVLEALFDQIALNAGMERMREVMCTPDPEEMLDGFVRIFTDFWSKNQILLKRIHGIAAIDPEFGSAIQSRNQRRQLASTRVIERLDTRSGPSRPNEKQERIAILVALTSFEFFDALAESSGNIDSAKAQIPALIKRALLDR